MRDIVSQHSQLFLGSRLKRLGERMQADVARIIEQAGLPILPSQVPLLAVLDSQGPATIGALVDAIGISQPAVTRLVALLTDMGLVAAIRSDHDKRHKMIALTDAGRDVITRSKNTVWPQVDAAVATMCAGLTGPLIGQIDAIERMLADQPLDRRVAAGPMAGLSIIPYTDALAADLHAINAQWIQAAFRLEDTDRDVLENPRARIIDPGGDILFVAAAGVGIVGTCALQKTGERQFELTKMGVLETARGKKAGEFLLRAMLRLAVERGAETLYLLSNAKQASAIHLYEKLGFVHDEDIMRDFGARYQRCNVAMRYPMPRSAGPNASGSKSDSR